MRQHVFVATVFHDVMSVADDVEAVSEAPVESELATQPKDGAIEDLIAAMEAPPAECVDDMSVSSGDEIVVTDHKPLKGAHLLTSRLFRSRACLLRIARRSLPLLEHVSLFVLQRAQSSAMGRVRNRHRHHQWKPANPEQVHTDILPSSY